MAIWADWLPDVLPHVQGAPVPQVEHEIKRAAQEFFTRARIWLVTTDDLPLEAGAVSLDIVLPNASMAVVRVERAWLGTRPLDARLADAMDDAHADDWETHTGTPSAVIQFTPGAVRPYPIPTDAGTVRLRVSVRPSDAADGIDDQFVARYQDAFSAGAKARLMLMLGKPWSNPEFGAAMRGVFDGYINQAITQAATGFGRGRMAATPRWC